MYTKENHIVNISVVDFTDKLFEDQHREVFTIEVGESGVPVEHEVDGITYWCREPDLEYIKRYEIIYALAYIPGLINPYSVGNPKSEFGDAYELHIFGKLKEEHLDDSK